jgi:hypothetical protein
MPADDELTTLDGPEGKGIPIDAALALSLEGDVPDPPADSELLDDEGED